MSKQFFILLQYILPKHLLSRLMGWLAESQLPWLKNFLITSFVKRYKIDLKEAILSHPTDYLTFNQFFIRQFKKGLRPIAEGPEQIASPVDGTVSQIGQIKKESLFQAKNFYFDLKSLLGNDHSLAEIFCDGQYATLYLAPHNYHRVHMPIAGHLEKTIFIPGKLFSVCQITSQFIPHLYSRNERLISLFKTDAGPTAIILVGAMLVGSIQPVWEKNPVRSHLLVTKNYSKDEAIFLEKGDELGYFKMGSTVILLFSKDHVKWLNEIKTGSLIEVGKLFGTFTPMK